MSNASRARKREAKDKVRVERGTAAKTVSELPAELERSMDLVARCRGGAEDAWRELVELYSRYVFGIARRGFRLGEQDAEDVFQEVFARVYECLDTLRDERALRAWIGQVTRRICVDRLRARAAPEVASNSFEPSGVDERLQRLEERQEVWEALGRLSQQCREILVRFFYRDESYKTIAGSLALPSGTVGSRISRCLDRLREELVPVATGTPR